MNSKGYVKKYQFLPVASKSPSADSGIKKEVQFIADPSIFHIAAGAPDGRQNMNLKRTKNKKKKGKDSKDNDAQENEDEAQGNGYTAANATVNSSSVALCAERGLRPRQLSRPTQHRAVGPHLPQLSRHWGVGPNVLRTAPTWTPTQRWAGGPHTPHAIHTLWAGVSLDRNLSVSAFRNGPETIRLGARRTGTRRR